ncbi:glycosyltransferase [Mammaliicoccus sciuri]|uniref:glycosyltransferase n=1 Tax=Mammaliicoccus sciuri TaxID=1296 RepID=UPI000E695E58|nr:glycosyltransferase [Mammaliicoccus sciuri]RIO11671.1 glycosyltransferase [Mammaliicoccus sciuri]RIO19923.1 glycosyltransferase [Mammaliicoccus sciuri]
MKVLFIGGIINNHSEYIKKVVKHNQTAADNFQKMIINTIQDNNIIKVISMPFTGSFPNKYRDIVNKNYIFNIDNIEVEQLRSVNLKGLYLISRSLFLTKKLLFSKDENIQIIYSMHTPFLFANYISKKINKDKRTILIVPDLPQYMNLGSKNSSVYKLMKSIDIFIMKKMMKKVDGFIFLTKYMDKKINKKNKPSLIIESVINDKYINDKNIKSNSIVYTGTLNYKYGINNLLNAFTNIKRDDISLIICGDGEAKLSIQERAKKDSRIIFKGLLTKDEIVKIQKNAKILINPRENNEEYTKYSFPSKLTEYLISGTPVICYKLDGIPDEYEEILHYCDYLGLEETIKGLIDYDDEYLSNYHNRLKNFIKEHKSVELYNRKINAFMKLIKEGESH